MSITSEMNIASLQIFFLSDCLTCSVARQWERISFFYIIYKLIFFVEMFSYFFLISQLQDRHKLHLISEEQL